MNGGSSRRVDLAGTTVDDLTLDEAVAAIIALADGTRPHLVVTPNVDHLVTLQRDTAFAAAYARADLRLADGAPVVALARAMRSPLRARVTGADLLPALCAAAAGRDLPCVFVGGAPSSLRGALATCRTRWPTLRIQGCSPPMGFDQDARETDRCIEVVREAGARILFLCVGAPKAEKWAFAQLPRLGPVTVVCLGGAIDFLSGERHRAPRWSQRLGLEWLYRLAQEPGRLWRRYLVDDLAFLPLAISEVRRARAARIAGGPATPPPPPACHEGSPPS